VVSSFPLFFYSFFFYVPFKGGAVYTEYGSTYWNDVEFIDNHAGRYPYFQRTVCFVVVVVVSVITILYVAQFFLLCGSILSIYSDFSRVTEEVFYSFFVVHSLPMLFFKTMMPFEGRYVIQTRCSTLVLLCVSVCVYVFTCSNFFVNIC
jgi:hypothetical protein